MVFVMLLFFFSIRRLAPGLGSVLVVVVVKSTNDHSSSSIPSWLDTSMGYPFQNIIIDSKRRHAG
jgi:hypothetical protein